MSKTLSGMMLVAGIALVLLAMGLGGSTAGYGDLDPSKDWLYDMMGYAAAALGFVGVAMFGVGAMLFARK